MRQDEIGATHVWVKEDAQPFVLHPECHEPLRRAWMAGEAFFTGRDCYDEVLTIKLGHVVVVSLSTPESQRLAREDRQADKLRESAD